MTYLLLSLYMIAGHDTDNDSGPAAGKILWTAEQAVEMGRRSGQARRDRAEAERMRRAEPVAQLAAVRDRFERSALGPMAAAAAMWTIAEVVAGRMKVRDPAAWVRVLVDVARLEEGQVTSATANVQVLANDVDRARELQQMARQAIEVGPSSGDVPSLT